MTYVGSTLEVLFWLDLYLVKLISKFMFKKLRASYEMFQILPRNLLYKLIFDPDDTY